MSGAQSRLAAAEILMATLEERRTLDEAMALTQSYRKLSGPDRGFARAMASAALRQLGQINHGLAPFLTRPLDTATPPSRAFLQIGAAQLWIMETPDHAAVGETVAGAKLWPRAKKAAGFLNAVLRKVAADRTAFDSAGPLAVWPDWLQETMVNGLGVDVATALAELQMLEPNLHLTVKTGKMDEVRAAFATEEIETEIMPTGSLMVPSGAVEAFPLYEDGLWWVQDTAAALPAKLLTLTEGQVAVDLCAAPGGKTMQLAATGAHVFAVDRSAKRLDRVDENLVRTRLHKNTKLIAADGQQWKPQTQVDAVLVDAPCSALGTLRRHPEGPWIKQADDVARYPDVQARLLRAALAMLKPGGELVYCVCSPLPTEGVDVVETVLTEGNCVRKPVLEPEIGGFEHALTAKGDVLTVPGGPVNHDAFYIARLVKSA